MQSIVATLVTVGIPIYLFPTIGDTLCYLLVRAKFAAAQHIYHLLFCDGALYAVVYSIPTVFSFPLFGAAGRGVFGRRDV